MNNQENVLTIDVGFRPAESPEHEPLFQDEDQEATRSFGNQKINSVFMHLHQRSYAYVQCIAPNLFALLKSALNTE